MRELLQVRSGSAVERPGRAFRLLAAATAVSAWALVVVGGTVRISESGLGCPDWPLCDGRVVPAGRKEPIVEYTHRAVAAIVVVLLMITTVLAWRRYRSRTDTVLPLGIALALVPLQALLGAIVVWLELPESIVGVHFMVGMLMLGLCVQACVAAWRGHRVVTHTFRRVAVAAAVVGLLVVSLGAAVVSADAEHACGEHWPLCNGGLASGGDLAILQVVHRSAAYAAVALALALLILGFRGHAPLLAALPPAALALTQVGLGIGLVLSPDGSLQHDLFRTLHVAGAAGLWVAVVAALSVSITPPAGAQHGH
jgi:heme A synthase